MGKSYKYHNYAGKHIHSLHTDPRRRHYISHGNRTSKVLVGAHGVALLNHLGDQCGILLVPVAVYQGCSI